MDYIFFIGMVNVVLDVNGSFFYEIVVLVVWDYIYVDRVNKVVVSIVDVFVFGSLFSWNEIFRILLLSLIELV